ncbi:protein SMAX1-LIKE 3-like isoform X1 [Mercurialis annua]|uniref:protein SMAX1-LIKE 3-like isoform X1 n=1 Tax=Mercurialis annua TaxID=3986 RepID=UPI00215E3DBC|nr:protein SMAX1-LIKE 3-like isoform X1 [Mercurialis annua]
MRAGICSVQQALTAEAASIVKQAVSLARRRGHAQVTPLHVASAMLASPTGLLRRACLQSHSHPLQCKALELCFNVALNRLPASAASALLGHHSSFPCLSNALVAAFKRAQAHQRRGSIENQQQPILALKIEIEQLIVSILDDPSVSRVMREAGFSSVQVKHKVEQVVVVPLEISSKETKPHNVSQSLIPLINKPLSLDVEDDVISVLKTMVEKKRHIVITGECVESSESLVKGVMEKIERGGGPVELRSLRMISFPLSCLRDVPKEVVEQKLMELRCIVKRCISRGVVLYLGDLKLVAEFWSNYHGEQSKSYYYSPWDHIIMELKKLVGEVERLWLIGVATFKTYLKCKAGHPSLGTIWQLHSLKIPLDSLTLRLNLNSESQCECRSNGYSWAGVESAHEKNETCCADFSIIQQNTSSGLPSWLKKHKEETQRISIDDKEFCMNTRPLLKKWNSFGSSSVHKESHYPHKTIKFASSPASPISISSHECNNNFLFDSESNLISIGKPDVLSNPNSSPNSASSSEAMGDMEGLENFKEVSDENMKILCSSLEEKVPEQKQIIPEIAKVILECRSGMRKGEEREETWLFFAGVDSQGKEKIARELATLVYGSKANFLSIGTSDRKRRRDEVDWSSYDERLGLALNENPHRVFFIEDAEQLDYCSQMAIKKAIQSGRIDIPGGQNVPLKDAIVIFSSAMVNNQVKVEEDNHQVISLDLNIAIDVPENAILQSVDSQIIFKIQE